MRGCEVKPPALGTVWAAIARIRYIDDTGDTARWVTVATCIDTPNAIRAALKAARAAHPDKTLWVRSDTGGSYIP